MSENRVRHPPARFSRLASPWRSLSQRWRHKGFGSSSTPLSWTLSSAGRSTEASASGPPEDEEEGEDGDYGPSNSALAVVKEKFNRAAGMLLDFLVEVMCGRHLQDCRQVAQSNEPLSKLLQETGTDDGKEIDFVVQLREIVKAFDNSTKSVSSKTTSAPAPSLMATLQGQPMEEVQQDRERVWRLVQAERRKYVTLSVVKAYKTDAIMACFRASGKVYSHNGTLNSSHRLVCASADLVTENTPDPWLSASKPDTASWKSICEFCASCSGSTDFVILFDGRMREIRRANASWRQRPGVIDFNLV